VRAPALVALAILLGVALRATSLHWGLADGMWFPDEGLWGLRIDPRTPAVVADDPTVCLVYPTGFEYATRAVHAVTTGAGVFASANGTIVQRSPEAEVNDAPFVGIVAAARVASATASVVGIVLAAVATTRFYGPTAGIVAAFLVATSPFDVLQTHVAAVDPLLATLAIGVLLASWHLARAGTVVAALIAGALVGIAFATKYTGLAFLCPVAWAVLEAGPSRRRVLLGGTATLAAVVAAALTCPRCAMRPGDVLDILAWHRALSQDPPFDNNRLAASVGWYARPWLYQLTAALPYMMGVAAYLLALCGVIVAVMRRTLADRLVLALVVPYFLVIGAAQATFPRHLLAVVPALLLLGARVVGEITRPALRRTIAGVVIAYSLALAATHVARLGWYQQEAVAQAIADRVAGAPNVRVAEPEYGPYFRLRWPLARHGIALEARPPGRWLSPRPRFLVVPDWYATAIRRDDRDPELRRELDALESGSSGYRPVERLATPWYLQQPLDAWLDPALAVDLWQGAIGFTVYEDSP
jgi:hypothetical protein